MTEFESRCFGISEQDIREQYMQSITARLSGLEMVAMGVLSDAQELMTFGNERANDQARKKRSVTLLNTEYYDALEQFDAAVEQYTEMA